MGLGVSIILIAVGAIMAWAVHVSTSGFNVHTVGYILLIVGIIVFLVELGWTWVFHPESHPPPDGDRGVDLAPSP